MKGALLTGTETDEEGGSGMEKRKLQQKASEPDDYAVDKNSSSLFARKIAVTNGQIIA